MEMAHTLGGALNVFVDDVEKDEIHGTLVMVVEPMPCSL